jgi:Zn ribbon nucleic-acid-binding protein
MSDYGCCTLSSCNWQDREGYAIEGAIEFKSCDDCPFYDKEFFKEVENDGFKNVSVLRSGGQGI